MTDPNTTDARADETPARTWSRMDLPERDGDGVRSDVDPFSFFTSGDEEGQR